MAATKTAPLDEVLSGLRVLGAVTTLCQLSEPARARLRRLNYSGVFLAISGWLSVWAVQSLGAGDVSDVVALRIFAYACWLYGIIGLWTVLAPGALTVPGLGRLRGRSFALSLPAFFTVASMLGRGAAAVGLSTMALSLLLTSDPDTRTTRMEQLGLCAGYSLVYAITLASIAALALAWSPKRARLWTVLFLVVPLLLDWGGQNVPNVVGGLIGGFSRIIAWGGR